MLGRLRRATAALAGVPAGVGIYLLGRGDDGDDAQGRPSRRVAHAWSGGASAANTSAADFSKWSGVGLPGGDTSYIFKENLVICYDARTRNPKWVMERVTRQTLDGEADRRVLEFYEESGIADPRFRTQNADYLQSGYDRGHLAPAANNRGSFEAMRETFSLANISPQVGPGFNRDYWARFEKFTRDLVKQSTAVYVVSGPLFLPRRRRGDEPPGYNHNPSSKAQFVMSYELIGQDPQGLVAVPTHFYKVVLAERQDGRRLLAAFVLPNASIPAEMPLSNFLVPIDGLERVAGVRFFAQYLTDDRRELLDARVPLLRGSNPNPHVAGILTEGPASSSSSGSRRNGGSGSAAGGGGLRINLDGGPEHLCEVVACQLPPEKFWEAPKPLSEGGGKGRRNRRNHNNNNGGGGGGDGSQDAPPPDVAKSNSTGFLSSWMGGGSGGGKS